MEKRKSLKNSVKSWLGPNTVDEGIATSAIVMGFPESDHNVPVITDVPDIPADDSGGILGVIGSLLENLNVDPG
jgi:hypothetical protein